MGAVAMQAFGFEDQLVRVVDQGGAPWFVAQDVCACLEIGNSRMAVAALDEDERDGVSITDAIGRDQLTTIISESGVYSLIFRSRKAAAVRFRKWVTAEVLPTLRRSGVYVLADNDPAAPPEVPELTDEPTMVRLAVVRESRQLFGRKQAQAVWRQLGLPTGDDANRPLLGRRMARDVPDSIRRWRDDCTRPDPTSWVEVRDLNASYRQWCADHGLSPENDTVFGLAMNELGHRSQRNRFGRMDRGGLALT